MRTVRIIGSVMLTALLAFGARAEDIDIYAGAPPDGDLPNVLIILDNSSNWSANLTVNCSLVDVPSYKPNNQESNTKMAMEKCALYNLIHSLPTRSDGGALFNVGLMLANESGIGGYPRYALRPMSAVNKESLKTVIRNLDAQNDKRNNAQFARVLYESFLYLSARPPHQGTVSPNHDKTAFAGGRYAPPGGGGCARNFLIFIANGSPNDSTDADMELILKSEGGSVAPITFPTSYVSNADQKNWADEYTRFFNSLDTGGDGRSNIVTHAIAVTGASSDGNYPNFIRSMAAQGGGNFAEASNANALTAALQEIFVQIQSVDSVFAAVSLPLSANGQGTYSNQVFVGMFRPDTSAGPRWDGNLKQYQLSYDAVTDMVALVDADGAPAVNAGTGFLNPQARSFWTAPSNFWANSPSGTPASASDSPDGEVAEKGGVAQRLRATYAESQVERRVYTCVTCTAGAMLSAGAFTTANTAITAAMLGFSGADAATRRSELIEWVRGRDNAADEAGPGAPVTVRPSIHGDVLHSRPVVIDFGGSTGVVVFYGSNDGLLRAVRGAKSGTGAGEELWSFVAPEFYGRLNRQRADWPMIRYPGITIPSALPRDYFFDGPIGVYRDVAAGRTVIYPTMRRGGRGIYAIEVTDPANPVLLWKRTSAQIGVLGETWSEPKVARLRGHSGPVLVMGAGYDAAAEDVEPVGATTMGNAVLVLDALTGATLRSFAGPARSVAADVALVDSDYDGYIDRAYAADVGANIFRIDFEPSQTAFGPGDWRIYQFADLSDGTGSRKFLNAPDVVATKSFTALMIGSGDREKPLKSFTNDRFFVVKDLHMSKVPPPSWTPLTAASLPAIGTESDFEAGCYLPLSSGGEKVVTTATSLAGTTYFSTHRPTPTVSGSCTANLGEARAYELPLFCKPPQSQVLNGGGLPPSPVAGLVEIVHTPPGSSTPVTKVLPFVIGGINAKGSALESKKITPAIPAKRRRPYWYVEATR
jgi:type IV pilus assembly protein PilY1